MPIARLAADTLIVNGVIRSLDAAGTVASAIAVKDERIVGVGTADELRPLADQKTEIFDAGGKTVLPGFIDAHTHFQHGAESRYLHIDWQGHKMPRTIAQALEDIRRRAAEVPPGQWIRGDGISHTRLAERRLPNRWELDAVAPDHPVALIGGGNFAVAANSRALQLAGITRDTPDPPAGRIERNEDGEPTGVLYEKAKQRLDPALPDNVLPHYPVEQRLEPLKKTVREVLAEGITSIHDMMVDPLEIASWQRLRRSGELGLRVQLLVRGIESRTPLEHLVALGLEHGLGDEWLRFGGVKMSIDGVCAYRAAAVYDPYPGEPHNCGFVRIPEDELEQAIGICHKRNIRLAVHAVGPRAVDMALAAYEKAFDGKPRPDMRHRLEHVHLPSRPGQLERIAALGLIVCAQPTFVWKHGDAWRDIWGHEGLKGVMPLRRMRDLGIHVFAGTDYPGTPISPFLGFRSALARRTRDEDILEPSQAITIDEALRLWTTAAAYGAYEEHLKGSLELGKLADLIVVSEDPYAVAPEHLDQIRVDLTMVGGRVAFTRDGAGV